MAVWCAAADPQRCWVAATDRIVVIMLFVCKWLFVPVVVSQNTLSLSLIFLTQVLVRRFSDQV